MGEGKMLGNSFPVDSTRVPYSSEGSRVMNPVQGKSSQSDPQKESNNHSQVHQAGRNDLRLVFWETTSACNLECIHCRRTDVALELARTDMNTEKGKRFIDSLSDFAKPILVFSGGEPLFRRDIFELATYAKGKGLTTALATNGTLIDEDKADRIVAAGFERVAISIDGANPATHDKFRGIPGSFARAIEGFMRLRRRGMSMQINCTLARHNATEKEGLYDLALALGATALHIFMLVPVGCGMEISEQNQLPAEEYEAILNWLYDKSKEKKLQIKATCAPHYYRIMRQRAKQEGIKLSYVTHGLDAVTRGCLAGSAVCFVSHKGEVYPCGYLPVTAGNVLTQSFTEIWERSPVFLQLRDTGNLGGKCGICEYRNVCEGCRARAFGETGDYLAEEPYCTYTPQNSKTVTPQSDFLTQAR
jgi:AdoMet-dependent heme synthase